jgi:hypothetical protein
MKKVLLGILVLVSFSASAQWTNINGNQRFVKGLGIPTHDTIYSALAADSSQIVLRPQDTSLYIKYKGKWKKVGASSGGAGTQDLQIVTNFGSSTDHSISINNVLGPLELGKIDLISPAKYWPLYYESTFLDYFKVKTYDETSGAHTSIAMGDMGSGSNNLELSTSKISQNSPTNFNLLFPTTGGGYAYDLQILNPATGVLLADTVATLRDVRTIDTTSLSNRINSKADTSALNLKFNISDTSSMLSH